jgi:hypothetical protein
MPGLYFITSENFRSPQPGSPLPQAVLMRRYPIYSSTPEEAIQIPTPLSNTDRKKVLALRHIYRSRLQFRHVWEGTLGILTRLPLTPNRL